MDTPEPLTEDYIDRIDWTRLQVPGDTAVVPAQGDLPAGRVEVVSAEEYARNLERVEAIERGPSGRVSLGARQLARGTGALLGWTTTGALATAVHAHRYYRAHDLAERIGLPLDEAGEKRVRARRRERWRVIGWSAAALSALNSAGWGALVLWADMAAGSAALLVPGAEGGALLAGLTTYGWYRKQHSVPPGQVIAPQHMAEIEAAGAEDDGEPYPLGEARTRDQVEDCVHRALTAEGFGVRSLEVLGRKRWGWELDLKLKGKGSTAAKLSGALAEIDTHLDLPQGGTMIEPDPTQSSHITLRLVASNPFADMPAPAVHAPRSLSVHRPVVQGAAMDGKPFELTFDGFCALVVGAMGAGKTLGALRTIAEALTAMPDAVCWDLDPLKDGLSEFGDLMEVRARGPEECEEALERVLKFVSARGRLVRRLGMGDRWAASPQHPHLFVFIDEYLQLSARGKELAIKIMRTSRQYGIYLVVAGQEATEDALGDAIAALIPYRILMPCRFEDIKIAFGVGSAALGWRPDRMAPAVGPIANDAGQSFIKGGPFTRAIRHQFNAYSPQQIAAAVPDRIAAGVTRLDADTLIEAGDLSGATHRAGLASQLAFSKHPDALLVSALLEAFDAAEADFLSTSELLGAPCTAGFELDAKALQSRLSAHAPGAKSERRDLGEGLVRGWSRHTVERAGSGLLDPVSTRQEPGTDPA